MANGRGWKLLTAVATLALVASAQAQTTRCLTRYEPIEAEDFDCADRGAAICDPLPASIYTGHGAEAVFQEPGFSGSTDGLIPGNQGSQAYPVNWSQTILRTDSGQDWFGLASPSYEISFAWGDPTDVTTAGVRATTSSVANLRLPSIHLEGTISFDIAVTAFKFNYATNSFGLQVPAETPGNAAVYMALGIKETGSDIALGDTDAGTGDLEIVYLPGSELIPAATNGFFADVLPGQLLPIGGKRMLASGEFWPPDASEFTHVEFDLGAIGANSGLVRGFPGGADGDGIPTSGDGMLDATSNGDGVNRGSLDSIIFTPDAGNSDAQYFFIYIDNIVLTSPEDDSSLVAPKVDGPLTETAPGTGTVTVSSIFNPCDSSDADSVELFRDGVSVGTTAPSGGVATFNSVVLTAGEKYTAKQTRDGITSDFSVPVEVFGPGVALADNFDSYVSQSELNEIWLDSISSPNPADAKLLLTSGGAASCPNFLKENNPAGANAARLYRSLGGAVNGTDEDPLWVTWNFKFTGSSTLNGRTRFELARFEGGSFTTGARSEGTAGITMFNQISGDLASQYNLTLRVTDNAQLGSNLTSNGWTNVADFYRVGSGVSRVIDRWHKMQIEVKSDTLNYFIDDVNVNPTPYEDGVPRPNNGGYTHVIIGEGFSNNNPTMYYDNVSVTIGSNGVNHPYGEPVPDAPTLQSPLFPGLDSITLTGISTNATEVVVLANGSTTIGSVTTTGFATTSISVPVTPLVFDDQITAYQVVGGESSCDSEIVAVIVPVVTIVEDILEPGETTVTVAGLEENLASSVRIYANGSTLIGSVSSPATDPVSVTVSPLVEGNQITATQVIGGLESLPSDSVLVRFRPPLKLSVTLALDEDGNLGGAPADFEFVGAASKSGSAPHGKPLLPETGVWQKFEFSLVPGVEPITDFAHFEGATGQGGSLTPDGGDYNIDSIFFSIDSNGPASSGPYTIYVDHLYYIDSGGNKVLISDAETTNPLPSVRGQSTSCLPTDTDCIGTEATALRALDGDTSIDGSQSVRFEWKWPNENPTNTLSVFRPSGENAVFPDNSLAVGFYVLFNDFTTNAVASPTLLEPNVGDVPFIRVQDVDLSATSVDLYRNGELYATEPAGGATVDFSLVSTNSVLLDQYAARQTTPAGTSEIGFPRGITTPPPPTVVSPASEGETSVSVDDVLVSVPNATTTQVTVLINGGSPVSENSAGFVTSPVVVSPVPGLIAGQLLTATQTVNGLVSEESDVVIVEATQTPCGIAYSESFDTDTSANWNINASSADNSYQFGFDWTTVGVPANPNTGNTLGLRLASNIASPSSVEAITLSPKNQLFGGDYRITFDMWMNAHGPFPAGGSGSTEWVTAGVGYDNTTVNQGGTSGSGGWFTCDTDGDTGRDYRAYKNASEQFAESGQFYAGTSSANNASQGTEDPYYAQFGNFEISSVVPNQTSMYPQQNGILDIGAQAFGWREVEIVRVGNTVTWSIDGLPIVRLDSSIGASFPLAGNISIGYMDIFSSVSGEPAVSFGLIDNLKVEGFPGGDCNANGIADGCPGETLATGDWDGDGNTDASDMAAFVDCLAGPNVDPNPSESFCVDACLTVFDLDSDGDVDLRDYRAMQDLLP
ncbi:MAG: hypothetical protein H6817_06530 [Phycisphaerales bacterium]|nr:hypothetical protein [Phycisphaerales bacterium]